MISDHPSQDPRFAAVELFTCNLHSVFTPRPEVMQLLLKPKQTRRSEAHRPQPQPFGAQSATETNGDMHNVFLTTLSVAWQRCQYERKLAMSSTLRQQLSDLRCGPMLAFRALCKSTRRQQSLFQRLRDYSNAGSGLCLVLPHHPGVPIACHGSMSLKLVFLAVRWCDLLIRRPTALHDPLKKVIGRGAALKMRMPHQLERSGCGTRGICIREPKTSSDHLSKPSNPGARFRRPSTRVRLRALPGG